MNGLGLRRLIGLVGPAAILLLVVSDDGIVGEPPGFTDSRGDVARYLSNHGDVAQWLGHGLGALAIALLLVFYATLADRTRIPTQTRLLAAVAAAIAIGSCADGRGRRRRLPDRRERQGFVRPRARDGSRSRSWPSGC